ncbi:MAG TPA: hypothetical protein DHW64_06790 [Chitinophagaceae bacterium]|jgi:hypothetical protein|nr:hypothetical protein [Chitinophagaceae bacterium]
MKTHNWLKTILLLMSISFLSCSKPIDPPDNDDRKLTYTITGNFSGTLFASYTTSTGGTQNEQILSVPWKKEIVYAPNVTAAIIAISGNGGVTGQQVTVVVKKGSTQLSTTSAIADNAGSFSKSAPVITF